MIDWSLIPEEIVAIDASADFETGNFYVLDKTSGKLVNYMDDHTGSIGVVLSVRPSAAANIVSVLSKTIEYLQEESQIYKDSFLTCKASKQEVCIK